jgi:hypothetical protein
VTDEAVIDAIKHGMTHAEVLAIAGEPYNVLPTEADMHSPSVSWLYRDARHSGGYTYVGFDESGRVASIKGSVSWGSPFQ